MTQRNNHSAMPMRQLLPPIAQANVRKPTRLLSERVLVIVFSNQSGVDYIERWVELYRESVCRCLVAGGHAQLSQALRG